MKLYLCWYVVVGVTIFYIGWRLLIVLTRYKSVTIEDVIECWIGADRTAHILAEIPSSHPRDNADAESRRLQWRIHRAKQRQWLFHLGEQYRRMLHDGLLLNRWGQSKLDYVKQHRIGIKPDVNTALSGLVTQATAFCAACRSAHRKMWWWNLALSLFPAFIALSSFTALRSWRGTEIVNEYRELKVAAIRFARLVYTDSTPMLADKVGVSLLGDLAEA